MAAKRILVGMPLRPGEHILAGASIGFHGWTYVMSEAERNGPPAERTMLTRGHASSSVLPLTFDMLWSGAVNEAARGELTHFAMIHDDVVPEKNWLGILIEEMEKHDAEIVSTVIPLKDERGLTSTAFDSTGCSWNPRRITMAELMRMPETFTAPDILLNTGLWLVDLRKPWVSASTVDPVDGKPVLTASFHQRNRIVRDPGGNWVPEMKSEDWEFSRLARLAGATRLYATRRVKVIHERPPFTNSESWGTDHHDKQAANVQPPKPLPFTLVG